LWRLWQERFALFNRGVAPERFESRVLAWLWLHPHGATPRLNSAKRSCQSRQSGTRALRSAGGAPSLSALQ
ncbi:hypothetical protein, partial [Aeromonas caviae]|uniref:hypothetical protein n=1 Tax=Aeromonas caviae TaxID=648 RepID=UPI001CC51F9E